MANLLDGQFAIWQLSAMKLGAYLDRENLSPAQFAARLGKPASTITRLLKGERDPGLSLLLDIATATDGAVTPNDFMAKGGAEAPTSETTAPVSAAE